MRLKSSHIFALAILGAVVLFFIIGTALNAGRKHTAEAKPAAPAATALPSVQVARIAEAVHPYEVVIRGRTQAARVVQVRSETSGVVAGTPVLQGGFVHKGDVLCRLNVDARAAAVAQARAALRSRQLTQQASAELARKGYRSETQVLQDQANLDSAQAALSQAQIALEQTNIRAPFDGVFDKRDAEIGAFLAPGQSCGTMIELDPILVVGDLPETDAGKVHVGASATAKLLSGEIMSGRVRYMARDADPQTRTYHLEVTAPNPHSAVRSGLSANVEISAGSGPAHLVPLATLVLDAAGRQGVRYVGPGNVVTFAPVSVLDETDKGIWVSGLHGAVDVIVVGQSYVNEGQKVRVATVR